MSLAANIRNGCNRIGGENEVFFDYTLGYVS